MPGRLSFDRVAAIYDETRSLAPRAMARVLAVLVDELHGKQVLEIGVGTGRYAVPLQKSGIRVVGVDISRKMVEIGLAKGLRDVIFADAARLPFKSGSFDVGTTNHVLHLIPDWRDALSEIARVTRDMYFTLIERSDRVETIKREYDALVKGAGYDWSHPGLHEKDCPDSSNRTSSCRSARSARRSSRTPPWTDSLGGPTRRNGMSPRRSTARQWKIGRAS